MPNAERDRDLESIQEARELGRAAVAAQRRIEALTQEAVDDIVEAMATAGKQHSARLAELAHDETGFGNIPDKIRKNDFVLDVVVEAMRGMRTVGVLRHDREHGVREIAEPVGVVAAIIPSTNPTSTAMFKCLIALKARCGIVLSPHPSAANCVQESASVMASAATEAGAPAGIIGCMRRTTMQGTKELMNGRETDLILATGGTGLVRAAYSAGKPAYGVGPGNVPSYIERSADVAKAVRDIVAGTTFDNGTLCSSEQAIVCDRAIEDQVVEQVRANDGYFLTDDESERLAHLLITDRLLVNPAFVGKPAMTIAAAANIDVPAGTRVLVSPQQGVGKQYPLSREKLSPVLAFYVVEDWAEGCERCAELLRFGGLGHSMSIHSQDDDVVLQFGLRKPAHRILVNTVAALGAVGLTTHLFPSMTLGCGSWGNNITSDNVGPQHLINVKRLAGETREYVADQRATLPAADESLSAPPAADRGAAPAAARERRDAATVRGAGGGDLEERVADFLRKRGIMQRHDAPPLAGRPAVVSVRDNAAPAASAAALEPPRGRAVNAPAAALTNAPAAAPTPSNPPSTVSAPPPAADFVAEEDVRAAAARGGKIQLGPDTIITPLARELGEECGIFRRH